MFESTRQGAVQLVTGSDPVTAPFADKLADKLAECAAAGLPRIVVDLTTIPLVDSRGLEVLLDAGEHCRKRGGALLVAGANPLCHDILRITGVSERIREFDDVSQAIRSFLQ